MATSPDEEMLQSLVDSLSVGGAAGAASPSRPGPASAEPGAFRLGYSPFSPHPLPGPPPIPLGSPLGLRLGGGASGAGLVPPSPRWGGSTGNVPPSPRAWGGGGGLVPPSPRTQQELEFIGGLLGGGDIADMLLTPRAGDAAQLPAGLVSPASWLRSPVAPTPTTPRTAGVLRCTASSPAAPGQASPLVLQPLPAGIVLPPELAGFSLFPGGGGGALQPVPAGVLVQPEPHEPASQAGSSQLQPSTLIHMGAMPIPFASAPPAAPAVMRVLPNAQPAVVPSLPASVAPPAAVVAPSAWAASAFAAAAAQAGPAAAAAAGGSSSVSISVSASGRSSPAPSGSHDSASVGAQEGAGGTSMARMSSLPNLPVR